MKLKVAYPSVILELLLSCFIWAMNDTLGSEGLDPSELIFGEYLSVRRNSEPLQELLNLSSLAEVAMAVRNEMSHIIAKQRIQQCIKHILLSASYHMYSPGDKVIVCSEKIHENLIGEWISPFFVDGMDVDKKLIFIRDVTVEPEKPFKLSQLNQYNSPEEAVALLLLDFKSVLNEFKTNYGYKIHLTEILNKEEPRTDTPDIIPALFKEIKRLL